MLWKLLRKHISLPQFAGFFFANLIGMIIMLLGFQFYRDVVPLLTAEDGFLKTGFVVVSKKVGTAQALSQRSLSFSAAEVDELASQPFAESVGQFTTAEFKVDASMSINGRQILNSELPIESVPDEFVDISPESWHFDDSIGVVPIILPRSYIAMYNFGFAKSKSLPKVSEGLVGMITFDLFLHGNGQESRYKGKVIGFSGRLNAILVPQEFMQKANAAFAPNATPSPTRLIMTTGNLAEENVAQYLEDHGYEAEEDRLNAEKTTFFLRLLVSAVMLIGFVISLLSFFILMLSIYLLVQKNAEKLQNLLLIGYRPSKVALPYQLLTVAMNALVLVLALVLVYILRSYYMSTVQVLFPMASHTSFWPAIVLGVALFLGVTLLNVAIIYRKIVRIWQGKTI